MQQPFELEPEAVVRLGGREGAAAFREAEHELAERVRAAVEECLREPARRHHAERVAVAAGVLGRDQPLVAGDPGRERTALGEQDRRLALVVLVRAQVTAAAEHVVQLVGVARIAGQLPLDLGERVGVDQLTQLFLAEQLAQEVAVERERLCATLGRGRVVQRCVALFFWHAFSVCCVAIYMPMIPEAIAAMLAVARLGAIHSVV